MVRIPSDVDVKAIRRELNLSQQAFAETYGFSLGAVRNWEQGLRVPERAARLLLLLIRDERRAVHRMLRRLQ